MAGASPAKRAPRKPKDAEFIPNATVSPAVKRGTKTYKFATITKEAAARMEARERERVVVEPFVLDDVNPPIIITAPDDLERILVAAEGFSMVQNGDMGAIMPLLRAICGDAFPRVWFLIRKDPGADRAMALLNALSDHFDEVMAPYREAVEQPGGSEDSSN